MTTSPTVEAINGEIRAWAARRKVSQAEIAQALGISQTAVSQRLLGSIDWRLNELLALAALFQITIGQLLETPVHAGAVSA